MTHGTRRQRFMLALVSVALVYLSVAAAGKRDEGAVDCCNLSEVDP